jgi:hypothetical protein
MSKESLDYLRKKYHVDEMFQEMIKKKEYRNILTEIFHVNIEDVAPKIAQRSIRNWNKTLSETKRKYIVPEYEHVVPSSEDIRSRSRGQTEGISNNLRMALTDRLREKANTFLGRHKEETYLKKRINGKLEREFEDDVRDTMRSFTRKDPDFGMPSNIHAIAVTELRTTIANIKRNVADQIRAENPGIIPKKTWIHNPHLSKNIKNIRLGHKAMNEKSLPMDSVFDVPLIVSIGGNNFQIGTTPMMAPHDPNAPASQLISCHCDIVYSI